MKWSDFCGEQQISPGKGRTRDAGSARPPKNGAFATGMGAQEFCHVEDHALDDHVARLFAHVLSHLLSRHGRKLQLLPVLPKVSNRLVSSKHFSLVAHPADAVPTRLCSVLIPAGIHGGEHDRREPFGGHPVDALGGKGRGGAVREWEQSHLDVLRMSERTQIRKGG